MEIKIISQEIVRLYPEDVNGEKTELTLFDACEPKIYVNYCYFYKNSTASPFSVERMIAGLKKTLEEYPEICGSIEYTTKGGILHHDNHGVKIIKSKANFSFADVEDVNFEIKKLPEREIFLPEVQGFALKANAYLFIAQIISLNDESLMLVVSFHHVLCDAYGIFRFMNAWSSATRNGNIGVYNNHTNRSLLLNNGDKTSNLVGHAYISSTIPFDKPVLGEMKKFYVSFDKLESLKHKFSEDLPEGVFISKNDVLTGIMWKAAVCARMEKKFQTSVITTVVNCRRLFHLPESYFGNCVPYLCKRLLTEDILKMSVKDICLLLRKNYDIMSKEYILDFLNWICSQKSIMPFSGIFNNELLFSSLAHYPMYECDFGLGKAINVGVASNNFPGFVWIFPTPGDDGLYVEFCLEEKEMLNFLKDEYVKDILTVIH